MEIGYWYRFLKENQSNKEIEKLIEDEFSVDKESAKQRINELKKIFVEFDDWVKIDILKEMVYCYINNQFISTIGVTGILVEIILEERLEYLDNLFKTEKYLETFSPELFCYTRERLRYVGQKIDFLKNLTSDEKELELIEYLKQIQEVRNKYIHIKFLNTPRYNNSEFKEDAKKVVKLILKVLHTTNKGSYKRVVAVGNRSDRILKI